MYEGKEILVIGGSYFAGRVFVMLALEKGYHLTLINRGTYSVRSLGEVTEFVCDRHDYRKLSTLPLQKKYEAVVDFCAYEPGDIAGMTEYLPCDFEKYIYLSTADVCKESTGVRNEDSELQEEAADDPVSQYTFKKMLLETELRRAAFKKGCGFTILRPVFIYGPYNYAPREYWYIRKIVSGEMIPQPTDADGKFQMVYVKDVARAVVSCIETEKSDHETYILSAPEVMTYESFVALLREVSGREIRTVPVTTANVLAQRIPLPFPLTERENALFDGGKIEKELGFSYGDQKNSMRLTWNAFSSVFEQMAAAEKAE